MRIEKLICDVCGKETKQLISQTVATDNSHLDLVEMCDSCLESFRDAQKKWFKQIKEGAANG